MPCEIRDHPADRIGTQILPVDNITGSGHADLRASSFIFLSPVEASLSFLFHRRVWSVSVGLPPQHLCNACGLLNILLGFDLGLDLSLGFDLGLCLHIDAALILSRHLARLRRRAENRHRCRCLGLPETRQVHLVGQRLEVHDRSILVRSDEALSLCRTQFRRKLDLVVLVRIVEAKPHLAGFDAEVRQQQFRQFRRQHRESRSDRVSHVLSVRHARRCEVRRVQAVNRFRNASRVVHAFLGRGQTFDVLHLMRLRAVLLEFSVTQQQHLASVRHAADALIQVSLNLLHLSVGRRRRRLEHHAGLAAVQPPLRLTLQRRRFHVGLRRDALQPRHAARRVDRRTVLTQVHHVLGRHSHRVRAVPAVEVPFDEAGVAEHRPSELARQDVRTDRVSVQAFADVQVRSSCDLFEPEQLPEPQRTGVYRIGVLKQVDNRMVEDFLDVIACTRRVHRRLADEALHLAAVRRVLEDSLIDDLAALAAAAADLAKQTQSLTAQHRRVDRSRSPRRAGDASRDEFVVSARIVVESTRGRFARNQRRGNPRSERLSRVEFNAGVLRLCGGLSLRHVGHAQVRAESSVTRSVIGSVPASCETPTHAPCDERGPSKYMTAYLAASRPSSNCLTGSSLSALPS